MNIQYDVDLSPLEKSGKGKRVRSELAQTLSDFGDSQKSNMQITDESLTEISRDEQYARSWIKRNNAKMSVSRRRNVLYIVKNA